MHMPQCTTLHFTNPITLLVASSAFQAPCLEIVVAMCFEAPCHHVPEPGGTARQAQQAEPMAEAEAVAQALQPTDVILIVLIAVVVFYLLPRQACHCASA